MEVFRRLGGSATPIWTVKANAYGHGLEEVGRLLAKAMRKGDWLGVDSLDEALALRRLGAAGSIIVLGWVPPPRLKELAENDLRLLVSSDETVRELRKRRIILRAHLKIDTGTTRQGVLPSGALALAQRIRAAGLELEGCATHFANIEDVANPSYGDLQIERFVACVAELKKNGFALPMVHAACSAAAMTRPEAVFSSFRIGIGLYGLSPSAVVSEKYRGPKLRPILSWRSRVALVKHVPAGTPVGYGLTEKTAKRTVIAIVPVGYSDGYGRSLSSKGAVLVRGRRCRVMGRICMNMMIVDATPAKGAAEGDEVTLIGGSGKSAITADELAEAAGTINYEIVARLAERLPRLIVA